MPNHSELEQVKAAPHFPIKSMRHVETLLAPLRDEIMQAAKAITESEGRAEVTIEDVDMAGKVVLGQRGEIQTGFPIGDP